MARDGDHTEAFGKAPVDLFAEDPDAAERFSETMIAVPRRPG